MNQAISKDAFWAIRRDAIQIIGAPQGNPNTTTATFTETTKTTFNNALKDDNSLVRTAAISALGLLKDAKYSSNFTAALNDQSYTVIDSAAIALARTGDKNAYDALVKLANTDSWKDHIRVAGLQGLATLGDKRALDVGFKYADKSNPSNVRTNALGILAASGKGDTRIYPLLLENFKQSLETNAFQGIFGGLQNFVKLADPRGQEAFDLAKDKFKENQNLLGFINQIEAQFKKAIEQK